MEVNYFTILYWFCHTSTWIRHRCTCVPNPEPLSHLPPRTIPLGHPSAPAPSILYHRTWTGNCVFLIFLNLYFIFSSLIFIIPFLLLTLGFDCCSFWNTFGDGLPRFNPWVRNISWKRAWPTHFSTPAWRNPWTEEPGRLQSIWLNMTEATKQLQHSVSHHPWDDDKDVKLTLSPPRLAILGDICRN